MPPSIKAVTIAGHSIAENADEPARGRAFKFSQLTHGPCQDPLAEAMGMLNDRDIAYGKPHNVIPGISVVDIFGEHSNRTPTQARFLVTYGVPQTGELGGQMKVTVVTSTSR